MLERRNGCDILSRRRKFGPAQRRAVLASKPSVRAQSEMKVEATGTLLHRETSVLLIVDVQERLAPAISTIDMVLSKAGLLIRAASRLGIPIAFTEQYASGLGKTLPSLRNLAATAPVISKIHFQATLEPDLGAWIDTSGASQIVIAGTEAHVCVLQTSLGLIEAGYVPFLVADAVGSRRERDCTLAIERLRSAGCRIVSTEMVLFEWLKKAATQEFRELLTLIKEEN
jgi:nicotinamidase-related amidase